ncbi:hypothetical protein [Komagataeibacter oboediens]|uniref:hypothetical protein n=1 Tax=Komagataeibacter oboediens TaxID=65958 RepID=UPI0012F4BC9C|nr:hypothetical protein [Komagataeibacter oboediens]
MKQKQNNISLWGKSRASWSFPINPTIFSIGSLIIAPQVNINTRMPPSAFIDLELMSAQNSSLISCKISFAESSGDGGILYNKKLPNIVSATHD